VVTNSMTICNYIIEYFWMFFNVFADAKKVALASNCLRISKVHAVISGVGPSSNVRYIDLLLTGSFQTKFGNAFLKSLELQLALYALLITINLNSVNIYWNILINTV